MAKMSRRVSFLLLLVFSLSLAKAFLPNSTEAVEDCYQLFHQHHSHDNCHQGQMLSVFHIETEPRFDFAITAYQIKFELVSRLMDRAPHPDLEPRRKPPKVEV